MNEEPVVLYGPRWNLNAAYMTPANMAIFRPAYKEKLVAKVRKDLKKEA